MEKNHLEILMKDFEESRFGITSMVISLKTAYAFFEHSINNFILRRKLKNISDDRMFDRLLLNEGRMFKRHIYSICNKIYPIKNSSILVAGTGYGRNLFQLASFRPKTIVAFDLYEYKEEWEFMAKKAKDIFGVEIIFLKGDFSAIPQKYYGYFDSIVSDAVFEHIKKLDDFIKDSRKFLKKDGYFYASFGPIWYGPGGDHIDWGKDNIFDHLLLGDREYNERFNKKYNEIKNDSCEGAFLVKEKLFSYLKLDDYFNIFRKNGFEKISAYIKISKSALSLLKENNKIAAVLDKNNVPKFDRFCSGAYVWMKLKK